MAETFEMAGRLVGPGQPCLIIAEAGVNHNGSLELACALVDAARAAGADAVKFQTFKAERLVSAGAPKAVYQQRTTGGGESQLEMIRKLELGEVEHRRLQAHCKEQGILFLSSPFDEQSADFLAELGVIAYKVPSGELTNLPFLAHLAGKGQPLILSTGMAYLGEVEAAVRTIAEAGPVALALLHCVSNYPADPADINLRAMDTMRAAFAVPVGYSDHVPDNEVAFAAVARGACILEKHFTLDRNLPGPDHQASLEPQELAALVRGVRAVEAALGDGRKRPAASEADTAGVARKSLVAARDLAAGSVLESNLIAVKRPGSGLPPAMLQHLLGRRTRVDIPRDALLSLEDLL